jgi:hypothetical protein
VYYKVYEKMPWTGIDMGPLGMGEGGEGGFVDRLNSICLRRLCMNFHFNRRFFFLSLTSST